MVPTQGSRLKFNIRRDHLLEDAYEHVMKSEIRHLQKKRLNITFKGEEGWVVPHLVSSPSQFQSKTERGGGLGMRPVNASWYWKWGRPGNEASECFMVLKDTYREDFMYGYTLPQAQAFCDSLGIKQEQAAWVRACNSIKFETGWNLLLVQK